MEEKKQIENLDDLLAFDLDHFKQEDQLGEIHSDEFIQGKNCKPGQVAAFGIYVGSEQSEKYGSMIHKVQTKEKVCTIYGSTDLDRKMRKVEPGNLVKIVFEKDLHYYSDDDKSFFLWKVFAADNKK